MHNIGQLLNNIVWISGIVCQAALCAMMGIKGSAKDYPRFFIYSLFGVFQSILLFAVISRGTYSLYFWTYWVAGLGLSVFGLLVIQEVFMAAMRPLEGLRDLSRIAFRWASGLMLIVAVLVGINSHPGVTAGIPAAATSFESSVKLMQVGLLLMLFTFSSRIGLSVKTRTFGIALGIGINAAVNMFCIGLLAHLDGSSHAMVNLVRGVMFLFSCSTWLAYFALPVTEDKPVIVPIASPLMRWNEIAAAIGHPAGRVMYVNGIGAEPFLPQVERLVDDVLSKQRVN